MAAAAGVEPRGEDEDEFERLSALLYESAEVSDYLLARMNAQRLAAAVMERCGRRRGHRGGHPGRLKEAAKCEGSANTIMRRCATSANTVFTGTAASGTS